ncbi:MAG: helicase [Thermoleophilia bacterium]|nr:helicase [Thermoleophilia bacterium]
MLLLHGALDGTDLLLWGEPFSDPAADVVRHVGQPAQAIDAAALEAELEHAFGELAGSRTPIDARMGGCTVPALRLDPPGAIALLARAHEHQSLLAPGLVADAALRVLARLARHAAAAVVRQELVPHLRRRTGGDDWQARWELLLAPDARDALRDSAHGLPASALALTTGAPATDADLLRIDDILRDVRALAFAGACADAFVRRRLLEAPVELVGAAGTSLHDRWLRALTRDRAHVDGPDDALERLSDEFAAWQLRLRRRVDSPFRLCFRLEEPTDVGDDDDAVGSSEGATWYLRFLVQSRADPSFLVALDDAWEPRGSDKATLRTLGFHAGEHLFAPLGEAAALADPIAASLQRPRPGGVECTTAEAHAFLSESAPLLEQAGFGVFVPAWWRGRGGRFQLSLRAKVTTELTGGRRNLDALNLETLVDYDWHLAIGDAELTDRELRDLAHQKTPLLHVRGQWVELDSGELRAAIAHVDRLLADPLTPARGGVRDGEAASIAQLVAMSVGAGGTGPGGLAISGVSATGDIGALLADLPTHDLVADLEPPAGLDAELRPYQLRGYRWLDAMARLGLGACLADVMGLGKTVQVLAAIQGAKERAAVDTSDTARAAHGPTLIACPTSVVTNWLRECQRFTPGLTVLVHHGPDRLTGDAFAQAVAPADGSPAADIVITSFALLARDEALLARIDWSRVVLDEAQNI